MYIASDLLIFSFGFTMLKFISCYSDGSLLDNQCGANNININHNNLPPQTSEAPFEVYWTPEENETSKGIFSLSPYYSLMFYWCKQNGFSYVPL